MGIIMLWGIIMVWGMADICAEEAEGGGGRSESSCLDHVNRGNVHDATATAVVHALSC